MTLDAVVVGAGPNGLSAAVTLARAGLRVQVLEAHGRVGGGLSSAELTLPGFTHDVGSAIHPLAVASPAFRAWPLHAFGLDWVQPEAPVAHPLPGGRSVTLERDLHATAAALGRDGPAWVRLMGPLLADWEGLLDDLLRPLPRWPRHPLSLVRFGLRGLPSAQLVGDTLFRTPEGRALWAGLAAHSNLPLTTRRVSRATPWPWNSAWLSALIRKASAPMENTASEPDPTLTLFPAATRMPCVAGAPLMRTSPRSSCMPPKAAACARTRRAVDGPRLPPSRAIRFRRRDGFSRGFS